MNYNNIITMLHYLQPVELQRKGITSALQQKDLTFLLAYSELPEYSYNCATIFTSLSYEKCVEYFDDLFSWIEDLNTPDAFMIVDYLSSAPTGLLYDSLIKAIEACVKRKNKESSQGINIILSSNKETLESLKQNNPKLLEAFHFVQEH